LSKFKSVGPGGVFRSTTITPHILTNKSSQIQNFVKQRTRNYARRAQETFVWSTWQDPNAPLPAARTSYINNFPSIHATVEFLESLNLLIQNIINQGGFFKLLIECHNPITGGYKSLMTSFAVHSNMNKDLLISTINEAIENFEAQSGSTEEENFSNFSRIVAYNNSDLPADQFTVLDSLAGPTASKTREARKQISFNAVDVINSNARTIETVINSNEKLATLIQSSNENLVNTITASNKALINAIKGPTTTTNNVPTSPNPYVELLIAATPLLLPVITHLTGVTPVVPGAPTPTPASSSVEVQELQTKINSLETQVNSLNSQLVSLNTKLDSLLAAINPNSSSNNGGNGNSSVPPVANTNGSQNSPPSTALVQGQVISNQQPLITELAALPEKVLGTFKDKIVTADLEALISPEGQNLVFMATWYNGLHSNTFSLSNYSTKEQMLVAFWNDLIKQNKGRVCYFHNFGGYDSILSLRELLSTAFNYEFDCIVKDGEFMSIKIKLGEKTVLTILDSIRILPAALSKLAKDWKVETLKSHFPHYLWEGDIQSTLAYTGAIPPYTCFESKRTSVAEYREMVELFSTKQWNFLEVSRAYILDDCKALYEVIIKFFETLESKFPIDVLKVLSAPSAAFRIWRTQQLPLLLKENLQVPDLSMTLDSTLRPGYCGGIVDVYRPHFKTDGTTLGYYYDVNSLYPTAMSRPMPVGIPTRINLTVEQFLNGEFFGFLETTVQAGANEYIGLLPIKLHGRLICPGGIFSGIFFSEELRFALANGYKLLSIKWAYKFEKGNSCFKELIEILNQMKIEGQVKGQPTIRNLAKLLMNSMYGRFGMKPSMSVTEIVEAGREEKYFKEWLINSQIKLGSYYVLNMSPNLVYLQGVLTPEKYLETLLTYSNKTNVAIAAAVTSYSRIIINSFKLLAINLGLEIYYSDTDSLVVNGTLPEEYISSTELGLLKLEHTIEEGIFVMPKVYYLLTSEGKEVIKCKGFGGQLTKTNFEALLNEETLHYTTTKWFRSMKDQTVQIKKGQPYQLNLSFNKRRRVFKDGVWVNTKPIIL
ncbi:hypothetical protein RclHR1_34200001, partial [Rhizophagus clarus]